MHIYFWAAWTPQSCSRFTVSYAATTSTSSTFSFRPCLNDLQISSIVFITHCLHSMLFIVHKISYLLSLRVCTHVWIRFCFGFVFFFSPLFFLENIWTSVWCMCLSASNQISIIPHGCLLVTFRTNDIFH